MDQLWFESQVVFFFCFFSRVTALRKYKRRIWIRSDFCHSLVISRSSGLSK